MKNKNKDMDSRTRRLALGVVLALCAGLGISGAVTGTVGASAAVLAAPGQVSVAPATCPGIETSYAILGSDDETEKITLAGESCNYSIRAYVRCTLPDPQGYKYNYGPWITSVNATSTATSPCPIDPTGGFVTAAGFQYSKTLLVKVRCWLIGDAKNGPCAV